MADNPELDRYWACQIDQKFKGLADQFERERNERIAQFTEDRKERRQYNEGVRNVIEAQTEAVRTLTAKVEQVLPEVRSHAEQIDELVRPSPRARSVSTSGSRTSSITPARGSRPPAVPSLPRAPRRCGARSARP
jgi:hypothetical protein